MKILILITFFRWQGEYRNCSKMFKVIKSDDGYCCSFNTFDVSEVKLEIQILKKMFFFENQGFSKPVETAAEDEEEDEEDYYHYYHYEEDTDTVDPSADDSNNDSTDDSSNDDSSSDDSSNDDSSDDSDVGNNDDTNNDDADTGGGAGQPFVYSETW